jgi:hypothetical protein
MFMNVKSMSGAEILEQRRQARRKKAWAVQQETCGFDNQKISIQSSGMRHMATGGLIAGTYSALP